MVRCSLKVLGIQKNEEKLDFVLFKKFLRSFPQDYEVTQQTLSYNMYVTVT